LRTGQEYLESLRDGREVWLNGKRVNDVTVHPALRNCAKSFSLCYDMQHEEKFRDQFTFSSESGDLRNLAFRIPRLSTDLEKITKQFEMLQIASGGVLSRIPPATFYSIIPQHYDLKDLFGNYDSRYSENIESYYDYCGKKDVMLCGGFASPKGNREKPPHLQDDPDLNLRIVEKNNDGVIVNGAKMLSTASVFANEIYVATVDPIGEKDGAYALCFTLPLNTKCVKMLCRQPLWESDDEFTFPLSSRYDEMDSTVIFDHVLVPWDRIFFAGENELSNTFLFRFNPWGALTYLIWCMARADLLVGCSKLATDSSGTTNFPSVKEKLADIATYASAVRAMITASVKSPITTPSGLVAPHPEFVAMGRNLVRNYFHVIVDQMYEITAAFSIVAPTLRDLESDEIGKYFEKYFGAKSGARERIAIYRLVKDLIASTYADRLELFQLFSEGSPASIRASAYSTFDFNTRTKFAQSRLKI
jgi:4-hydroxyphenylacetate 3-monooxygenase